MRKENWINAIVASVTFCIGIVYDGAAARAGWHEAGCDRWRLSALELDHCRYCCDLCVPIGSSNLKKSVARRS